MLSTAIVREANAARAVSRRSTDGCAPEARSRARRADLEWLRVIAMLAVFATHTAQVFTPWQYWHIQNDERSLLLGHLTLFVWPWVMPLFMLLAGAGAGFSLRRRSDAEFRQERTIRLVVPFVLGVLVLVPPQIWVERLAQGRFEGDLLQFYPHFFECCYPHGNLAASHLWFIAYLWVYAIALLPLLRYLSGSRGRRVVAGVARVISRPGGVLLLSVPIVLSQIALRGAFPQTLDLINDWANHALLILAYVYGYLLLSGEELAGAVAAQWQMALAIAVTASTLLALYAVRLGTGAAPPDPYTISYFAFWAVFGVAGGGWLVALIGFAQRFLRAAPPLLVRASQAVFPIYLLHQTVIVLIAYHVVQWPTGVLTKFGALLLLSFATTTALAVGATRVRPLRTLIGVKGLPALRLERSTP